MFWYSEESRPTDEGNDLPIGIRIEYLPALNAVHHDMVAGIDCIYANTYRAERTPVRSSV